MKKNSFIIGGGDMRQVAVADFLSKDGHDVYVFAMGYETPKDAAKIELTDLRRIRPDYIILPLPLSADDSNLNCPFSKEKPSLRELFEKIPAGVQVLAGVVRPTAYELARKYDIELTDYYDREELAVANAIPTAEGAIQIAMDETSRTLHGSRCLVTGYGRIGKVLSRLLMSLGAHVTVAARKYSDLTWIGAMGMTPLNMEKLSGNLSGFDLIFNTVPALIFYRKLITELKSDCLYIDLASKPGGIDFLSAGELGVRSIWALSLPGKVAPISSGAAIRDTIYNIMEERGRSI